MNVHVSKRCQGKLRDRMGYWPIHHPLWLRVRVVEYGLNTNWWVFYFLSFHSAISMTQVSPHWKVYADEIGSLTAISVDWKAPFAITEDLMLYDWYDCCYRSGLKHAIGAVNGVISEVNKQRVLMHRHQGLNVRHGLCHIYMRYLYIYELFIAFVCFVVCSLL